MELVMTMIYDTFLIWTTWLIPHLMANNSTSVVVMLTVWWITFLMDLESELIWVMEVAILFLMLASETTITELAFAHTSITMSLSFQRWANLLSLYLQLAWWNEKWLENILIILELGKSSLFRELNNEKIPLRQLLTSTMELLILSCCIDIMFFKERQWDIASLACLSLKRDLIVWLDRRVDILSWCLLLSF